MDRNMLWKILRHTGIPEEIIELIEVFHKGFQARILHEGDIT